MTIYYCQNCGDTECKCMSAPSSKQDDALEEILLLVREDGDAWEAHCRQFKRPGTFEAWKAVRHRLVAALREYWNLASSSEQAQQGAEPTAQTVKDLMLGLKDEDRPGNLWESTTMSEKAVALKVLRAFASRPAAAAQPKPTTAGAYLRKKADDYAMEYGHDDMGGLSFGSGAHAEAKQDYHNNLLELADELDALGAAQGAEPDYAALAKVTTGTSQENQHG